MLLQQQPKLRELPQVPGRDWRHLKTPPALGQHKAFRRQPVEDFAQRRDADAVVLLPASASARPEPAEHRGDLRRHRARLRHFGVVLNVVCGALRISKEDIIKGVWPFMIAQLIVLLLMVLFPSVVTVPAKWFGC
jgi:hypothetical protein